MSWDFSDIYAGLKDFQLASVEHAAQQLFGDAGTRRFLVADEVGLGKTMVARGLIARALEHHERLGTERIDVVYVCSNGDIARQNVRRLNVLPDQDFSHATRLTMLPRELKHLQDRRVNFVSFTPGTSFNLRSTEGVQAERALIHNMLRDLWGDEVPWRRAGEKVLSGYASFAGFRRYHIQNPANQGVDRELLRKFGQELTRAEGGVAGLQSRYLDLHRQFSAIRSNKSPKLTWELRDQRARFVGELREHLAHACVEALEPDLVILDEFQRFKHLFDPEDPAGALAKTLFEYEDVAVVLLSATPYKMYTHGDEDEDHYRDFVDTVRFLRRDDAVVDTLASDIGAFRRAMLSSSPEAHTEAMRAKGRIEVELRRVMSRNERLAASENRSGMLEELPTPALHLAPDDVRRYCTMTELGDRLGVAGARSYWEATPYPLSHLEGYVFGRRFERVATDDPDAVNDLPLDRLALDFDDVHAYQRTDPGNSRMRSLEADVVDRGLWRLLWLPPSLPYYELGGVYAEGDLTGATKRLVFSAWTVVPRAIATHLSYEAERRMMTARGPAENTAEARKAFRGLLQFSRSQGRLTGMPALALLYPSQVLAELGDPLAIAREMAGTTSALPIAGVLDLVRRRIDDALEPLRDLAGEGGAEDPYWFWAAPFLLDAASSPEATRAWLSDERVAPAIVEGLEVDEVTGASGLREHLDRALELLDGQVGLGPMPEQLVDVLADLAVAGPGVCAARALTRANDDADTADHDVRLAAAAVAGAVRSVFNAQDVTTMLRAEARSHVREDAYWRLALRYAVDGCLQAVFDEWVHVLIDALGLRTQPVDESLPALAAAMREGMTVQTVNYGARRVDLADGQVRVLPERMRGHFALRFGDERSETDKSVQRSANVRVAFNSPFRPFVLATTSVGQEGLDFHTYCHAVVHWNLPRNPVDLEQREGRVHRYKNHAVRRNLASQHRVAAMLSSGDPWEAMFDAAVRERPADADELVPYWVYPRGDARIERYVPALPLSKEAQRFEELKRSTAAYRLVFGQPRQDDLIAFLEGRGTTENLDDLRIDLRPRAPEEQS